MNHSTTRYFMKWLTWSQVAHAPPPPPASREVADKPTYIPVTLKASTETFEADLRQWSSELTC